MIRSRGFLALLGVVALFLLSVSSVFAIDSPDSLQLPSTRAYRSVLESGDMLFVVQYNIDYAVVPTTTASEAFLIRFFEASSEYRTTAPYNYHTDGYGEGLASFYFSALDVVTYGLVDEGPYTIRLQGSLSYFTIPPVVNSSSIVWKNALATRIHLDEELLAYATLLEDSWGTPLVVEVVGGFVLTSAGEYYFMKVIPGARQMAPEIFAGRVVTPSFEERDHDLTYAESLRTFWDDTSFDANFQRWADLLGVSKMLIKTLLLVAFNLLVMLSVTSLTKRPDFAPLTIAVIFPVGALVGMTDMILAGLMAAGSVMGVVFILFLRRA